MGITRAQLKVLRTQLQDALDYMDSDNFELQVGNMRFTDTEVTIKLEGKLKGAKSEGDRLLEMMMKQHGLKETSARGDTLFEYAPRRHKYPFGYRTKRGAHYKCTLEQAKARFG